jgi:hypothetical protein
MNPVAQSETLPFIDVTFETVNSDFGAMKKLNQLMIIKIERSAN